MYIKYIFQIIYIIECGTLEEKLGYWKRRQNLEEHKNLECFSFLANEVIPVRWFCIIFVSSATPLTISTRCYLIVKIQTQMPWPKYQPMIFQIFLRCFDVIETLSSSCYQSQAILRSLKATFNISNTCCTIFKTKFKQKPRSCWTSFLQSNNYIL